MSAGQCAKGLLAAAACVGVLVMTGRLDVEELVEMAAGMGWSGALLAMAVVANVVAVAMRPRRQESLAMVLPVSDPGMPSAVYAAAPSPTTTTKAARGGKRAQKRRPAPAIRKAATADGRARKHRAADQPDIIIVGGGTAGCVLADRLSADGTKLVLLLEAGKAASSKYISMPYGVLKLFKSDVDWNYQSGPEPHLDSDEGVYLCRGKVLGGSSCTNIMLYNRGDANDYDAWARMGCQGWDARSVLPFFKRAENNQDIESAAHGTAGPMHISNGRYDNALYSAFEEACAADGHVHNPDFNDWSHSQHGYGRPQVFQSGGRRVSAESAYLAGAVSRPNLRVVTGARALRLIMDGLASPAADRRGAVHHECTGVECLMPNGNVSPFRVAAGGDVIVCGGALATPQLMMLSGVGPAHHLRQVGVPVRVDAPGVGQRLQDHPAAVVSFQADETNQGISVTDRTRIKGTTKPNPVAVANWLFRGQGPLCSVGCDAGGFFSVATPASSSPDLQVRFLAARALNPNGMTTFTEFLKTGGNLPSGYSLQVVSVRARSLGSVRLASTNALDDPVVVGNYLSDGRDLVTLRKGLRLARKLGGSSAFAQYGAKEVFPGPAVQTDDDLDRYVQSTLHTANALVGTCKMGAPSDAEAVVDSDSMRVYGVAGLRVVDSSVMPTIPGGQTGASTVMIAEKAATMILGHSLV